MSSALQKQHQRVLRNLMKIVSNKKCADCGEQCAVNVDTTHSTFICTNCSGIHREFGHRIKSVSMATFTPEEINALQATNNDEFNKVFMGKWKPDEYPLPLNADDKKRREFLQMKYVDKKWFSKKAQKAPAPAPVGEVPTFNNPNPTPSPAPVQSNWSPFGNPTPSPQVTPAPAPQPQKNEFDIFEIPTTPQVQMQNTAKNDIKNLLDMIPSTPQNQPKPNQGFGQPQPGFGQPARPNQPQTGFGQPQSGFGQPQTGFGQPQTGFGQPQTGFGQPQPGFGQPARPNQPQTGFGQPQTGFGQPQTGFGQPQTGFGQPQTGFGQPQTGFGQPARPNPPPQTKQSNDLLDFF